MLNRVFRLIHVLIASAVFMMAGAAWAQSDLMRFDTMAYSSTSGWHDGGEGPLRSATGVIQLVQRFSTVVEAKGANIIRVHFGAFDLDQHCEIRMTSFQDGAMQRFTQYSLTDWQGWSAMFNGDAVLVELLVARGERAAFSIDMVAVNDPAIAAPAEGGVAGADIGGLCGSDTRTPSNDPRVGRMSSALCGQPSGPCGGCTGWLTSIGSVVTAGHCGGVGGLIEFNVPSSQGNGAPLASLPSDQYAMGASFYTFQNAGGGFDWGILDVVPNSNTGLRAHWVQGYFHLSPSMPGNGGTLRITGYGLDNQPTGAAPSQCCNFDADGNCTLAGCNSSSLTLQTATGPLTGTTSNAVFYRVSSQPANSGSPLIRESNDFAVGVLTHGGCTSDAATSNSGTRLTQSVMAGSLDDFLGGAVFVDYAAVSGTQNGTGLNPMRTVIAGVNQVSVGGTVLLAGGNYTAAAGNTGVISKACTINAASGNATIGN